MIETVIEIMKEQIVHITNAYHPSIYLYGSVAYNDFRYGWSDIDILCLTGQSLSADIMNTLLTLRQELVTQYSENLYRSFEGMILSLDALVADKTETVVYWGTSGQRLTSTYSFDCFSMYELKTNGILLYGNDVCSRLPMPSYASLREGVIRHYHTIRQYSGTPTNSLYTCGWILDIARCLYTLRTGSVISKTEAGEWALSERICNVPQVLQKVLEVRKNPTAYQRSQQFMKWASQLESSIQQFADVLEEEINHSSLP